MIMKKIKGLFVIILLKIDFYSATSCCFNFFIKNYLKKASNEKFVLIPSL